MHNRTPCRWRWMWPAASCSCTPSASCTLASAAAALLLLLLLRCCAALRCAVLCRAVLHLLPALLFATVRYCAGSSSCATVRSRKPAYSVPPLSRPEEPQHPTDAVSGSAWRVREPRSPGQQPALLLPASPCRPHACWPLTMNLGHPSCAVNSGMALPRLPTWAWCVGPDH